VERRDGEREAEEQFEEERKPRRRRLQEKPQALDEEEFDPKRRGEPVRTRVRTRRIIPAVRPSTRQRR
jgi:hypothetical protein